MNIHKNMDPYGDQHLGCFLCKQSWNNLEGKVRAAPTTANIQTLDFQIFVLVYFHISCDLCGKPYWKDSHNINIKKCVIHWNKPFFSELVLYPGIEYKVALKRAWRACLGLVPTRCGGIAWGDYSSTVPLHWQGRMPRLLCARFTPLHCTGVWAWCTEKKNTACSTVSA